MADILLSVGVQTGTAELSKFRDGINDLVTQINNDPPKVQVGVEVSKGSLDTFRQQLSSIVNGITLSNGSKLSIKLEGIGEINSKAESAAKAIEKISDATKKVSSSAEEMQRNLKSAAATQEDDAKKQLKIEKDRIAVLKQAQALLRKMQDAEASWTKAANGRSKASYAGIQSSIKLLKGDIKSFTDGSLSVDAFKNKIAALTSSFDTLSGNIKRAGENTQTFMGRFGKLTSKFTQWFGASQFVMKALETISKMISVVVELDTAMTELKKVTDATDATYDRFLDNAVDRAKAVGASLTDVVTASADFARLGYNLDEASYLADTAIIYKNVADGISDISVASESIISTMQAFGIATEDAMSIVDKFNNVSNNFAISSAGVGEALQRSAAAMKAAGANIDETIALITAANTVVQNPESVGKFLPNNAVMHCKKTAISVKGRRRLRPRKDFVVCARRVRSSTGFCYTPEVITVANKTGVYIQCEYCGKTIYKTLSQYNKRKQHFCSNKCQLLLKREITFEHRPCKICGKDMYISKKATQRFCSNECQRTWQLSNTGFSNKKFQGGYVKCESCGKSFLVGKYVLDSNRKHFCSTSCRQTWYSTVWSQSENWRLKSRERAANLLKNNPATTQTKPQTLVNGMLYDMGIAYRNEEVYTYYSIDNYLPEFDLAIEVMGDYWHSSPLKYPVSVNDRQRHIISRDKAKHTYLRNTYDIEILYLWESDILKRPDVCKELIRYYIEHGGNIQNYHSFNYSVVDDRLVMNDVIVRPYQDGRIETAC